MIDSFACPRCNRTLNRSGSFAIDGREFPIFQCEECLMTVEKYGEPWEVAYTFAVTDDGRVFCPAAGDDIPS